MDELERKILGLDEDAEGEVGISMMVVPKPIARKEEEEEEVIRPPKASLQEHNLHRHQILSSKAYIQSSPWSESASRCIPTFTAT